MECIALCTASSYQWKELIASFRTKWPVTSYKNALHVNLSTVSSRKDLFIFSYGALVFWNVSSSEARAFLPELRPFEVNSLQEPEEDHFEFKKAAGWSFKNNEITLTEDTVLERLAYSHAIAQSVKLEEFEVRTRQAFEKNNHLPEGLARFGKISLSRKDIRKKWGQLFLDRSSINLHVDVLDTPDFFWEYPEYEKVYELSALDLDLQNRTRSLNQQLDVINDLFAMLGEELNHQHSSRLEWAIIWLIVIEVVLFLTHDILAWI